MSKYKKGSGNLIINFGSVKNFTMLIFRFFHSKKSNLSNEILIYIFVKSENYHVFLFPHIHRYFKILVKLPITMLKIDSYLLQQSE